MNILVLGGNGYIGSRLCDELSNAYDLINVDCLFQPKMTRVDRVEDYSLLTPDYIQQFSHIILLAGHSSVASAGRKLLPSFLNNVTNFVRLVESIRDDQTLLYASTAANYGFNHRLVWATEPISDAVAYYDFTKVSIERIANLYPQKKLIGLRFGTVGGWSKNFRYENLLNSLSINAIENREIQVSCADNWRAVVGLSDLIRCIRVLVENDPICRFYNIVSYNKKIGEIANEISELSGATLSEMSGRTTGYSFNCSNELFCNEFGFEFRDTTETIYEEIKNKMTIRILYPKSHPVHNSLKTNIL